MTQAAAFSPVESRARNALPAFLSRIANLRLDAAAIDTPPVGHAGTEGNWYVSSLDLRLGLDVCELDHSDAWREWECVSCA